MIKITKIYTYDKLKQKGSDVTRFGSVAFVRRTVEEQGHR